MMAFTLTRREPRMLERAPARLVAAVRGCGCGARPIAAAVLRAVGVRPLGDTAAWDPATWREHLQSEEDGFFAKLRALGDPAADAAVDALMEDHKEIRRALDAQEALDTVMIQRHAQAEDDLAIRYRTRLVPQVGAMLMISDEYLASVQKDAPPTPGSGLGAAGMLAIVAGVAGGALLGGWPFMLGGALLGTGVAYTVLAPSAPTAGHAGKLGGDAFNGKDYSDASITEGELAEAASHGDKAASDELARRQMIDTVNGWCGYAGLGDKCEDYVKAGLDIGNAIVKATSEDLASSANTPEQKARLANAVSRIMLLGYPPTKFTSRMEFGVQEQADTIEEDIAMVTHGPTYAAPFLGTLSIATLLTEAGQAALATARARGPAADALNRTFGVLANRRSVIAVTNLERPVALWDAPPTADNLVAKHPMLAYLAEAAAGHYGVPLARAYDAAAKNAASFNDRHGLTSRADTLNTDRFLADTILVTNGGPCILAEAWFALRRLG